MSTSLEMEHQISLSVKGLLTSLALILFLVDVHVILEAGLLGEGLATLWPLAEEWFLFRVNHLMSF